MVLEVGWVIGNLGVLKSKVYLHLCVCVMQHSGWVWSESVNLRIVWCVFVCYTEWWLQLYIWCGKRRHQSHLYRRRRAGWFGVVLKVWYGMMWYDVVWYGVEEMSWVVWCGAICCGILGIVGMMCYDVVWYGLIQWYGHSQSHLYTV